MGGIMRAWVHGGGGEHGVHGRAAHLCVDCRCRSDSVIKSGRGGVALPVGAESVVAPIRPPEHRQSLVSLSAHSAGRWAAGHACSGSTCIRRSLSEADELVHVLVVGQEAWPPASASQERRSGSAGKVAEGGGTGQRGQHPVSWCCGKSSCRLPHHTYVEMPVAVHGGVALAHAHRGHRVQRV